MPLQLVAGFGMAILVLGIWIVALPNALPQAAEAFLSPSGLWVAAAFRLTLGILLWMAAVASRTPRIFRVLGVLAVLGALALPVVGLDGLAAVITWGTDQSDLLLRGMGLMVTALGAFLFWAARTRKAAG